jgi:tetratricopeptide (TPR) repeat protein
MPARLEASRLDDYYAEVILLASLAVAVAGNPERGVQEAERALARHPLDSLKPLDRPYLKLAFVNAMAGRIGHARALVSEYQRVVEPLRHEAARDAELDLSEGYIALAQRRWPEATARFQEALNERASVFGLPALARAYDLGGQADSAIALYERYLDTPEFGRAIWGVDAIELPGIYRRLGELYERQGQKDKARMYYSRFVELWKDCDPELRPEVDEARRLARGGE